MKHKIIAIAAAVTVLSLSVSVHAEEHASSLPAVTAEKPAGQPPMGGSMNCPMMGDMQQSMGNMMGDMNSMMQMMSDPSMKERMQKMHENMGAMMQQMTDMQKGMGGMMMQGGKTDGKKENAAPTAAPEDKDPHHPDKQ